MFARQPTFFREDMILYATFPGSAARGSISGPSGYWLAWCPDIKSNDRAMAFQVYCHAISNCGQTLSSLGMLDAHSIRFTAQESRKNDLRSFLVNAWYTHYQFGWTWHSESLIVAESAKWVPHPGASIIG